MTTETKSINYSDGDIEKDILTLVKHSSVLTANTDIAYTYYKYWPVLYHLSSMRSNCIRHLNFSGLEVLEFGAGMGAMSRFVAEKAKHLTVVEGTQQRFDVLQERLRDLKNWTGQVANYQDFKTEKQYDVVCFFGVFEYAGRYIQENSPFDWALQHARSFLKPGGVLLITIENKNGFKYFAGCTEDHLGRHFAGLCGYSIENDIKTFSRKELTDMLIQTNLPDVDVHHLWPDYKLSRAVITDELMKEDADLCASIAGSYPSQDYSNKKLLLFPECLAIESLGKSGLLGEMSNSYLFLASEKDSPVKNKLLRIIKAKKTKAVTYSAKRKYPVRTTILEQNGYLTAEKEYLDPATPDYVSEQSTKIYIKNHQTTPIYQGPKVSSLVINHMYYGKTNALLELLDNFFNFIFETYKTQSPLHLAPEALDATWYNTIYTKDGFKNYDCEYTMDKPMDKTYFIFRNIAHTQNVMSHAKDERFASLENFYNLVCARYNLLPKLEQDRAAEIELQLAVCKKYSN